MIRSFATRSNAITAIQIHAFVNYGKGYLSSKRNTTKVQFVAYTFFIRRFQKAGTEGAVNFDGGTNDLLREAFMQKVTPCLLVSGVNHVCKTPTLNSGTSGFSAAASSACTIASRVSTGSIILSIHKRAAPYRGSVCSS